MSDPREDPGDLSDYEAIQDDDVDADDVIDLSKPEGPELTTDAVDVDAGSA